MRREVLHLTVGRWLRSLSARRAAVLVLAVFAALSAVYVSVGSFALSGEQQAARAFGSYAYSTYDSVDIGAVRPGFFSRTTTAFVRAGINAHLEFRTDVFRPDSLTRTYVAAPVASIGYVEAPGLLRAFPGQYSLTTGRWPGRPRDVVVTSKLAKALSGRSEFSVLSGRAVFTVVGVVADSYAKNGLEMVAGEGTWESLHAAAPGHSYQPTQAQVYAFYNVDSQSAALTRVLDTQLPPLPAAQGARAENFDANRSARASLIHQRAAGFGGSDQLVVSYAPLLLVVLLTTALVVTQARRDVSTTLDRLLSLGVDRRAMQSWYAATLALLVVMAAATGAALGWLIALALRAAVLPRHADGPLGPVAGVPWELVAAMVVLLIVTVLPGLVPRLGAEPLQPQTRRSPLPEGLVRRVWILLSLVLVVQVRAGQASDNSRLVTSYVLVLGVILLGPDGLKLVSALINRVHSARCLLAGRFLRADMARQAAAVLVVAGCVAIPICAGTQLASDRQSAVTATYSRIPNGQVWVQRTDELGDLRGAERAVAGVPGLAPPVLASDLQAPSDASGAVSSSARFTRSGPSASGTAVLVVTSVGDLERVTGPLPHRATEVLTGGGVLDLSEAGVDQQVAVYGDHGQERTRTAPLVTFGLRLDRTVSSHFSGALLTSTARTLGLPVSGVTTYIYTGVSSDLAARAVSAVTAAGYDMAFVQYPVPPPPPTLPATAYVFVTGLVLGTASVLVLAVQSQARRLRSHSSRLVALGVPPRFTRSVLLIQTAAVLSIGGLLGVTAGVLGVELTSSIYATIAIPTSTIVFALLATLSAAVAAAAAGLKTLKASDAPLLA